jgi:hypothetical protein
MNKLGMSWAYAPDEAIVEGGEARNDVVELVLRWLKQQKIFDTIQHRHRKLRQRQMNGGSYQDGGSQMESARALLEPTSRHTR